MVTRTIPDKARSYGYLFAESTTAPLDRIQSILGLLPDETTQAGEPVPDEPHGRVHTFTTWTLFVPIPRDEHFGLHGLTRWLEGLDDELAERFRQLSELGVDVGLNIVQNVKANDDVATQAKVKNFELSPRALRWLADAGATLAIDQYFETDSDRAGRVPGR
jgi:hypothetical protein